MVEVPSTAAHAYNRERELKNSLEILFNISVSSREGTIRYAMLRLHRQPLTPHQLEALQTKCGDDVDLSSSTLQLYSLSGTVGNVSTFSLRKVHSLHGSNFSEEEWVEFTNMTRMYKDFVDSLHILAQDDGTSRIPVTLRLAVDSACSSISPTELGFTPTTFKQKPQLVKFSENDLQKQLLFSRVGSLLATTRITEGQRQRSKRQAACSNYTGISGSTSPTPALEDVSSCYNVTPCRLYNYEVNIICFVFLVVFFRT